MDPILTGSVADQRRDRTSVKWRLWGPDVLPLWVAEMDARPCPAVIDAVTAAVRRGDTGYPLGGPYADAVASFAADRWGWTVDPKATIGAADVMIGIEALIRVLTRPDGAVILSPPVYDSFFGFVATSGRRRIDAPLGSSRRLDLDALDRAFAEATTGGEPAAYLLCNPHNPVGTVHTRAELASLAALADEHGVTVISDEIHAPLVFSDSTPFTPWLTVSGRGFTALSASKSWNLAGFKAALVLGAPESVADLRRVHEVHTHGVGHLGSIAHVAAFTGGRDWLDQVVRELDANRDLVGRLVAERLPGVTMHRPEATYLAWLDFRGAGLGDDPATVLRERAGVALSSGPSYGAEAGKGFARLNFATSPEILYEAIDRIARAL
jgi:cystathionine beta-lyase